MNASTWRHGAMMAGLVLLTLLVTGCGYAAKPVYPQDVQSVQVPIFQNRSFYRGLEFDLTEALIKEIELRTPYKVVSHASADTVLEGTIVAVNQHRLSRRPAGGLAQELEMQLVVDVSWRNLRTGQVVMDRKGLVVVGRYIPPMGQTYQSGQAETAQKMATQIVSAMGSQW